MNNKKRLFVFIFLAIALTLTTLTYRTLSPSPPSPYDYTEWEMLPRFVAKEFCSCLYIVEQSPSYCHDYVVGTKVNLAGFLRIKTSWLASPQIEKEKKEIQSSFLGFFTTKAQFHPDHGCRLVE